MAIKNSKDFLEECWFLYGVRIGPLYIGRLKYVSQGTAGSVDFDWQPAMDKKVIGWYHTHPGEDFTTPSATDHKTMRSWVKGRGDLMLCGIKSGDSQKCYAFYRSDGTAILYNVMVSFLTGNFFVGMLTLDERVSI